MVLQIIVSSLLAVANLVFWWQVNQRGGLFQRWVERYFDVTIRFGSRGHWVVEGDRSWLARLGIELLQLAYYMGAFLLWGLAMIVSVLLLGLIKS